MTDEPRHILGVDIGLDGGLALLTEAGELVATAPVPTLEDLSGGRRTVNPALLIALLHRWRPSRAYVEWVGPRPSDSKAGAFAFGMARATVETALAAAEVPYVLLTPPVWKRAIGIPPGRQRAKDLARSEACRRWPRQAALFSRARDAYIAESALIAVAGLKREGAL